jgi:hypothetical protein
MKKLLLLTTAISLSLGGFAQSSLSNNSGSNLSVQSRRALSHFDAIKMQPNVLSNAKSTGVSDTFFYVSGAKFTQLFNLDSSAFYIADAAFPADSGAYFGTNVYGANAFGEWYNIPTYGTDTTVKVLGALARWGGTIQSGSNKMINIKLWNVDTVTQTPIPGLVNAYLIETPGTQIYSQSNISVGSLKIDTAVTRTLFTTAQTLSGAFFLGYDITYTWGSLAGDTLGLWSTRSGKGWDHGVYFVDTSTVNDDTLVLAQTVRRINNQWRDVLGFNANMSIVPVIVFQGSNVWPSNVPAITTSNLALYGNYPNPANNNTNIKFSLERSADVTVQIIDIAGRIVITVKESGLSAGEHTIPVQTSNLASGSYTYMISTSNGGALAAQFSVVK